MPQTESDKSKLLSIPILINLEYEPVPAEIRNLSAGETLVEIHADYQKKLSNEMIGQRITLYVHKKIPEGKVKGRVIRIFQDNGPTVIALEVERNPLWRKFYFDWIRSA